MSKERVYFYIHQELVDLKIGEITLEGWYSDKTYDSHDKDERIRLMTEKLRLFLRDDVEIKIRHSIETPITNKL